MQFHIAAAASSSARLALLVVLLHVTASKVAANDYYADNVAAESSAIPEDSSSNDASGGGGEITTGSYVLPKQIFNDGKPFYLAKNPVSGALDFNGKKTLGYSSPNSIHDEDSEDKELTLTGNSVMPNFHDFLNLPVKYTSSKFVYPLVSSSYANLKYQGNNKNFVSNHKNATIGGVKENVAPQQQPQRPNVYEVNRYQQQQVLQQQTDTKTTTTTRPTTVAATMTTTTTTTMTTTRRPETTPMQTSTSSMEPSTPFIIDTTTTNKPIQLLSGAQTITKPPQFTRPPLKYTTNKYKYSTIRKRPTISLDGGAGSYEFPSSTPKYTPAINTISPAIAATFGNQQPAFQPLPPIVVDMTTTTFSTSPPQTSPPPTKKAKKDPTDMSLSELFNSLMGDDDDSSSLVTTQMPSTTPERTTLRRTEAPPATTTARPATTQPADTTATTIAFTQTSTAPIRTDNSNGIVDNNNFQVVNPPTIRNLTALHNQQQPQQQQTLQQQQQHQQQLMQQQQLQHQQHQLQHYQQQQYQQQQHQQQMLQQQQQQQLQQHAQRPPSLAVLTNTNNIVIAPEQNSVSFVLGSQQSVGPTIETNEQQLQQPQQPSSALRPFGMVYSPGMQPQGFAHVGTAPNVRPPAPPSTVQIDNIPTVHGVQSSGSRPQPPSQLSPSSPSAEGTGTGFRFPVVGNNFDNAPIVTGTFKNDDQPAAISFVFPPGERQHRNDSSNLVSFGEGAASAPNSVGDDGAATTTLVANQVKFVQVPTTNVAGQPQDSFQVPVHAQMNYPVAGQQVQQQQTQQNQPQRPAGAFVHEPNKRPSLNRLHLTQQQKQQLHQHAQQQYYQQQQQKAQQQQQQQQHQRNPPATQMPSSAEQQSQMLVPPPPQHPSAAQQHQHHQQALRRPQNTTRPIIGDRLLPNILPQFRPNAKIGYGGPAPPLPPPNSGTVPAVYHQHPHPQHSNREAAMRIKQQQQQQQPPPFNGNNNLNRRIQQQRPLPPHLRRPADFNAKMAPSTITADAPINNADADANDQAANANNANRRYFQLRPALPPVNPNERIYNGGGPQTAQQHQSHPHPQQQPLRRFVDQYQQPQHLIRQPPPQQYADAHLELAGDHRSQMQQQQQPKRPVDLEIIPSILVDSASITQTINASPVGGPTAVVEPIKLEPVVTLQQLQHQKQLQKQQGGGSIAASTAQLYQQPAGGGETKQPSAAQSVQTKPPVYVVYPVKTAPVSSESPDGEQYAQRQQHQQHYVEQTSAVNSNNGNEYQNTPFTVIRQEQEPILVVRNKNAPKPAANPSNTFPYPLERPASGFEAGVESAATVATNDFAAGRVVNRGQQQQQPQNYGDEEGDGFGYDGDDNGAISSKLTRITERPIAIAYTPTEPNRSYHPGPSYSHRYPTDYSHANHASSVIAEIRDSNEDDTDGGYENHNDNTKRTTTQQQQRQPPTRPNDTDEFGNPSRGDGYRQEFDAPFYPSANLDKNAETVRNSWAVVTPPSETASEDDAKAEADSLTQTTSKPKKTTQTNEKTTKIDRSDDEDDDNKGQKHDSEEKTDIMKSSSAEMSDKTTAGQTAAPLTSSEKKEKFHPDNFQPEFQGGFQPIYPPPGMKATSDEAENSGKDNDSDQKTVAHDRGTEDESIAALVYDGLGASLTDSDSNSNDGRKANRSSTNR